jgi:DNA-binding MarR family transcriptional regulator
MRALDPYVIDTLMGDLAGHDRSPASFIVWLFLWRRTAGIGKASVALSLQDIARATSLSKSAVQASVKRLKARRLISTQGTGITAAPFYAVHMPWRCD